MVDIETFAYRFLVVVGAVMCLFGTIGNLLNIYIFFKWSKSHNQRTSNSPVYLLICSIANLFVIIYPFVTRLIIDQENFQIQTNQIFLLCKFRYYCLHTFDLISLTCLCMATIDRYLISSREVRLRQLSTTRRGTKLIILFIICIHSLHSIPIAIFYNISPTGKCAIQSLVYHYYYLYVFQICLHSLLPIICLTIFGYFIFRQLKNLRIRMNRNSNIDQQMNRMLLLMSSAVILSAIPYSIEQLYYVIMYQNDEEFSPGFYLFHVIASLLFYTNPVSSFYIYYISTTNFRIHVRRLFQCKQIALHPDENQRIHTIQTRSK